MAFNPSTPRRSTVLIQFERRGRARRISLDARTSLILGTALLFLGLWALGATLYLAFRDDVVGSLMERQSRMRTVYEDRIASLRSQMDRVTSRQLVDQDSFEGKVQELVARQAQLETRQALVNSLVSQAAGHMGALAKAGIRPAPSAPAVPAVPAATAPAAPALPGGAAAFAPQAVPPSMPFLRGSSAVPPAASPAAQAAQPRRPMPLDTSQVERAPAPDRRAALAGETLGRLEGSLQGIASWQETALGAMESAARGEASRLRGLMAETGLDTKRFKAPQPAANAGGPLVPLPSVGEDGPFADALARVQHALLEAARMREIVAVIPLGRPLPGDPEVTSTFGTRVDPFTRGLALHTGLDLRDDYGTPVRVTAPGTVTTAEWTGGYGNMVEVDHGNGLSTRYGHLSVIAVSEGDRVAAGAVVGKVGSTGRSTGPHLHYETRIDGEPVDPQRFLRVARRLGGDSRMPASD